MIFSPQLHVYEESTQNQESLGTSTAKSICTEVKRNSEKSIKATFHGLEKQTNQQGTLPVNIE